MSLSINKAKSGFWRRLFNRNDDAPAEESVHVQSSAGTATRAPRSRASGRPQSAHPGGGQFIHIPLASVINALPLELRGRAKDVDVSDVMMAVPQSKVLGQLAQGAVRISFGEIRAAAPSVFSPARDSDSAQVTLPLNEILSRLNPELLVRRTTQRQVEVSSEISGPFDVQTQGLMFSMVGDKPTAVAVAEAPATVAQAVRSAAVPSPVAEAIPSNFDPIPRRPVAKPTVTPVAKVVTRTPAAAPAATPASTPVTKPPLVVRITHPPKTAKDPASMPVSLSSLAESWPETLRQEIVRLRLTDVNVALPIELMEVSLKRGRVVFPWKVIRSWIRPTPVATASTHDGMDLELPLKVIAPLFLTRRAPEARPQQKADLDEAIPNLFFGFPKPDAPAPEGKPTDTNYYVWDDTSETANVDETAFKKRMASGGTEFVVKYATPNEIVSRAAALDGVAGALIALPDGLMVASQIPPELNGDTMAAFLPQIFGKVSQTTKELRMGELNNLNFTVGNVPWKIFRVNAIFFAAFGRPGQSLPTGKLAELAGELNHKNK